MGKRAFRIVAKMVSDLDWYLSGDSGPDDLKQQIAEWPVIPDARGGNPDEESWDSPNLSVPNQPW